MQLSEAIQLIQTNEINNINSARWTDLGCGSGTFTYALANLLSQGSRIYAVDKLQQLNKKTINQPIEIEFIKADFEKDELMFSQLNGILMANSLHYVSNKANLIQRLKKYLLPNGMFLIVEYNTMQSNRWVPYPIDFMHLQKLFSDTGFTNIKKLGEKKSVFNRSSLYSCLISL